MLSLYGIETSGTVANRAGTTDGLFFANTGDTSSSAFRIYSSERAISYQVPHLNPTTDIDALGQPIDSHATYHAGNRSNNPDSTAAPAAQLYIDTFPSVAVPAAQADLFPETQFGSTVAGAMGFAWHAVEITKVGTMATWKVNGILLGSVEMEDFVTPTGGTNIFFGHADVNSGVSIDSYYDDVSFTLIDDIEVTALTTSGPDGDYNDDGFVDGADFLVWQRGESPNSLDPGDLEAWKTNYGTSPAAVAVGAVPEPTTLGLAVVAVGAGLALARSRTNRG
jgi:hypothetical protein